MLKITLTKTSLYFKDLDDFLYYEIKEKYPALKPSDRPLINGYKIEGTPVQLYDVLFHLSYTYDIELI